MGDHRKNTSQILQKLGIEQLNAMQKAASEVISHNNEVMILSPTGSGKTLAFLLPTINLLDPVGTETQALILTPTRELAIQIEQVCRNMGSGYKVSAVYGGRPGLKDKAELKSPPAILIGTPGRIADHLRNEVIDSRFIKILILDEFDKSLEIGFSDEMQEIIKTLKTVEKKILTSATKKISVPGYVRFRQPATIDFLAEAQPAIELRLLVTGKNEKLQTLTDLLKHTGRQSGIIFCNYKDSIKWVSDYLADQRIDHSCFYGGLEQKERERALIRFRNGTVRLLLATDLAARGIDVPDVDFIIHFELPARKDEFIHRNGRTARMQSDGVAYILQQTDEQLPDFIGYPEKFSPNSVADLLPTGIATLFVSGGRKDKISKGDLAGFFMKEGGLEKEELGLIELKQDCAFVAVPEEKASGLLKKLNNMKLKKKKVRVTSLN